MTTAAPATADEGNVHTTTLRSVTPDEARALIARCTKRSSQESVIDALKRRQPGGACRASAKMRQRREPDDDLEVRCAAYVSTFSREEGRPGILSTAGIERRFDV